MCIKWWNETTSFKLTVGLFFPQRSIGSNNRAELWIHTHMRKTFCSSLWIISSDWYNRDMWISSFLLSPSFSLPVSSQPFIQYSEEGTSPVTRVRLRRSGSLPTLWGLMRTAADNYSCSLQCWSVLTEIFSLLSRCHPRNSRAKFSRSRRWNEQPQERSFTE